MSREYTNKFVKEIESDYAFLKQIRSNDYIGSEILMFRGTCYAKQASVTQLWGLEMYSLGSKNKDPTDFPNFQCDKLTQELQDIKIKSLV